MTQMRLQKLMQLGALATTLACACNTAEDSGKAEDSTPAPVVEDTGQPTEAGPVDWGEETTELPEFYPTTDIESDHLQRVKDDYTTASTAWGNFGPLEFWIVGTDVEAARQHDITYCDVRMEKDPSLPEQYREQCLERGYSFEDYAQHGGAGLNLRRNETEEYSVFIVTLSSMYPFPDETDYTVVTYHEYFHVYQHAHVYTRDETEREQLMLSNPWWAEGGAEYMAQLLYSRQLGVNDGYLKERMSWKMSSHDLLEEGESFTDIDYGERAIIAYDVGAWFVAYLIHRVSEEAYLNGFYDDLNDLGWEGAFAENFGIPSKQMLSEFEDFLVLPIDEQLEIVP